MRCPNCTTNLSRGYSRVGYLWICHICEGSLISLSVLRKVLPEFLINKIWNHAHLEKVKSVKSCPICKKPGLISNISNIILDICNRCQFIWFDRFELDDIAKQSGNSFPMPVTYQKEDTEYIDSLNNRVQLYQNKISKLEQDITRQQFAININLPAGWKKFPYLLGMPVELTTTKDNIKPLITWIFSGRILLCSLIFILFDTGDNESSIGFISQSFTDLNFIDLFTYAFVNPGLIQLLINTYFILTFGDDVENFLGGIKYSLFLAGAILAGSISHLVFNSNPANVLIGTEVVVAAILIYYLFAYPRARIGFLLPLPLISPWMNVPIWFFVIVWLSVIISNQQWFWYSQYSTSPEALGGGIFIGLIFYIYSLFKDKFNFILNPKK